MKMKSISASDVLPDVGTEGVGPTVDALWRHVCDSPKEGVALQRTQAVMRVIVSLESTCTQVCQDHSNVVSYASGLEVHCIELFA